MANVVKDLGAVSAYALAVKHGYKGTEEEWATLQVASADNAASAAQSATAAAKSEGIATAAAESAQKTLESKGWLYVEGREDGNLYLVKHNDTDGIAMKDDGAGRLVVVYGT